MQFFGGNHWETFAEVEPHLISENAFGAGAGTVVLFGTVFQNMF